MFAPPTPVQSLQARAQPGGVTPELLRLLAQMKVKQETDAAMRDMAMKMNQQPPTVAQQVEQSNVQQKMQQMAGLPGLMAQGQTPPAQGTGQLPGAGGTDLAQQMPMPPTQGMARGGIVHLRSNLPGRYAGGGIVAFSAGDEVRIPGGGYAPERVDDGLSYTEQIKRLINFMPELLYGGATKLADMSADAIHTAEKIAPDVVHNLLSAPGASAPLVPNGAQPQSASAPTPASAAPQAPSFPAPGGSPGGSPQTSLRDMPVAGGNSAAAPRQQAAAQPQAAAPMPVAQAPQQDPAQVQFQQQLMSDNAAARAANPDQAREQGRQRWQSEVGQGQQASIDSQRGGIAALRELQAKRAAAAPSAFQTFLNAAGQNINARGGLGGAMQGVGAAVTGARTAAADQAISDQERINILNAAMQKAIDDNNYGGYQAAEKARDSVIGEREKAQTAGAQIADMNTRMQGLKENNFATTQTSLANNKANHETQIAVANIHAAAQKASAKIASDRQEALDNRNDINGLKSEIAAAEKTLTRYSPDKLLLLSGAEQADAVQEIAWAKAVREGNRARLAQLTGVEYKGAAPGAGAPGLDLSKWGQPKVK